MEIRSISKRENWYAEKDILVKATNRWLEVVKGASSETFLSYIDILINQGNGDAPNSNMIDVDDYLYLVINAWVKNANSLIKGIYERVAYVSRTASGAINKNMISFQRLTEIIESTLKCKRSIAIA